MKKKLLVFLMLSFIIGLHEVKAEESNNIVNESSCIQTKIIEIEEDTGVIREVEWQCNLSIRIVGNTNYNSFRFHFASQSFITSIKNTTINDDKIWMIGEVSEYAREANIEVFSRKTNLSGTISIGTISFRVRGTNPLNLTRFVPTIHSWGNCQTHEIASNGIKTIYYYDQNGEFTDQLTYQKQCEKPTCHVYEDGTYSGTDGNMVSELEYQKRCQTHKCETLSDGTKYGPTGSVVSDSDYQKQCEKPTCHVYEDGTYSGTDGNMVSELEYQKQCQTHKCETLSDGTKYGPTGSVVSDSDYQKQCFVNMCKIIDNTYFGVDGTEVTKEEYDKECTTTEEKHYCEKIEDTYYDNKGQEVSEAEYQKSCQINICKIIGDTYFGETGKEITEEEYYKECTKEEIKITCQNKDGNYYGPTGAIITKLEYQKQCEKNYCIILSDGTHYDQVGKIVSKEEYIKSCGTIENPKTGFNYISYVIIIISSILGICFYLIGKKNKIYYLK